MPPRVALKDSLMSAGREQSISKRLLLGFQCQFKRFSQLADPLKPLVLPNLLPLF